MQEKVDLEKINESFEKMSSLESVIHYNGVMDDIGEVERILEEVNFYHGNCINYQSSLEEIGDHFLDISSKIHELVDSIRLVRNLHAGRNHSDNSFLKVSPTALKEASAKVVEDGFNAMPIAVAIGATAAAGSVGAIVVDGVYRIREKDNKYRPNNTELREKYIPPFHESDYSNNNMEELEETQPIGEEIELLDEGSSHESYHASSDMGRYYNDERGFHLNDEDTDDVDYDDFYE